MLITKVTGTLRLSDEDRWEVALEFEVVDPEGIVETWTNGSGWTELGSPPNTPGFNGLQLAGEATLSEIEADIEVRGCRPKHAFSRIQWKGMDARSCRALKELGEI
jgi:hypothetical protein